MDEYLDSILDSNSASSKLEDGFVDGLRTKQTQLDGIRKHLLKNSTDPNYDLLMSLLDQVQPKLKNAVETLALLKSSKLAFVLNTAGKGTNPENAGSSSTAITNSSLEGLVSEPTVEDIEVMFKVLDDENEGIMMEEATALRLIEEGFIMNIVEVKNLLFASNYVLLFI